jgi:acyl-CoA reductase-like NAD-dependent aldehyde dehydrogenase
VQTLAQPQTLWIGNREIPSESTETLAVLNPATEESLGFIPRGSPADAAAAVAEALKARGSWSALSPGDRKKALAAAARAIVANRDEIARLLTLENGKPLAQSQAEIDIIVSLAHEYGELAVNLRSGHQETKDGELAFNQLEPRGVAACIVPWNYPLVVAFETLLPNLAVGNTVVLKPSEKTPLATRLIFEKALAQLPPGVCNLILGDGPSAGEPLVRHPDVDVVMFIGSVRTGRQIGRIAGEQLKKVILELGGKDPFIVDETADVSAAAKLCALAAYANCGQICTSTERIYVQRKIFEPFLAALEKESRALRVGDGLEPETEIGPLIDDLQLATVQRHVEAAKAQGAEIRTGGARLDRRGYFFGPTVMTRVTHEMAVMREETFGPVAPVMPFDDFEEAIALANDSVYGLASIVCTNDAKRAIYAIQHLQAGMIKINTNRGKTPGTSSEPRKASGLGYGYGAEVLYELTSQKSVHWRGSLM